MKNNPEKSFIEIFDAIHLMQNSIDIEVKIKSKKPEKTVTIKNPHTIDSIYGLLDNMLKKKRDWFNKDNPKLNEAEEVINSKKKVYSYDWWCRDNLDDNETEEIIFPIKKGPKYKHETTAFIINYLQKYLQDYTEIKAEEGTLISREQSRFIFSFLEAFELYEKSKNIHCKEDNVYSLLETFREKKSDKK